MGTYGPIEKDYLWKGFSAISLYHCLGTGEILDPTGRGLDHLMDRVVRVVDGGVFRYIPMRILDAILLSVTRGFDITPFTHDKMVEEIGSLKYVGITYLDIEKILTSPDPVLGLKLWEELDILYYSGIRDVRAELMNSMPLVKSVVGKDRLVMWAALLWGVYWREDKDFDYILNCLYFQKEDKSNLKKILQYSDTLEPTSERLRGIQYYLGERLYWSYVDFMEGLLGKTIDIREPKEMFTYKLPVKGADVLRETNAKGKEVGEILKRLLGEVFKDPSLKKEDLICLMYTYR